MHGPTCIFWANLTPFSLQVDSLISSLRDDHVMDDQGLEFLDDHDEVRSLRISA
jgi:hypothetical protein